MNTYLYKSWKVLVYRQLRGKMLSLGPKRYKYETGPQPGLCKNLTPGCRKGSQSVWVKVLSLCAHKL